jgi:hypothetical protein
MALIGDVYASPALRPVNDSDLLVRPRDAAAAAGALRRLGFAPAGGSALALQPPWIDSLPARQTSIQLRHPRLGDVALSWVPFAAERNIDEIWARATPTRLCGAPVLRLSAGDHLLRICAGGIGRRDLRPLWWIPDAMRLLGRHAIDWTALTEQARRSGLTQPLSAALGYLAEAFDAPAPRDTLERLAAMGLEAQDRMGAPEPRQDPPIRRAWRLWRAYRRHRRITARGSLLEFLRVVRNRPLLGPAPGGGR